TACTFGIEVCSGAVEATTEICDGKDNDCNIAIDNGFDTQNDPRFCGQNCVECNLPNALVKCQASVCQIAACLTGWINQNGNHQDGCEYACTPTGTEICDGIDNDCNGQIDTGDPGMVPLSVNPCRTLGPCAGATASCQGTSGWVCNYSADVQLATCTTDNDCMNVPCTGGVCPGEAAMDETLCDNKDNDCDNAVDEPFANKGLECSEQGKQGICQGTGTFACTSDHTNTYCMITTAGKNPVDEICNDLDDDCDGAIDEETDDAAGKGVEDAMVHIQRTYSGVAYDYYIYKYEASRPDASGTSAGASQSRACSKPSVLPWANIDYADAADACAAAGLPGEKRLCTATEWFLACSGAPVTSSTGYYYPYGNTYAADTCNGKDNDGDPGTSGNQDITVPTGTKSACVSYDVAYDMAGNLREWTNDPQPPPPDPLEGYTVRGGAYDTSYEGMKCGFTFAVFPPAFAFPNLGFRCCSNSAP
ncbi:MAG: SUMF1/EgtB/PvdO family nonheme iron enzyme, partial [Pseudomonadota bacterium]